MLSMFQRLSELLFGRLGEATQEQAMGPAEEDWLLVSLTDGENLVELSSVSTTESVSKLLGSISENSAVSEVSRNSDPEVPVSHEHVTDDVTRSKVLKGVKVYRVQGNRQLGHRCIQRQNRVHLRYPHRPIVLQQPTPRGICH